MPRSHAALATPAGPPPEVLADVDEAWERARESSPDGLVLGFESEPALKRAWGTLCRPDGTVLVRLPAAAALALACGDAVACPQLALAV